MLKNKKACFNFFFLFFSFFKPKWLLYQKYFLYNSYKKPCARLILNIIGKYNIPRIKKYYEIEYKQWELFIRNHYINIIHY